MTDKPKKTRTPKNAESILQGALKLILQERVAIVKTLKESIQNELKSIEESAAQAKNIVNGL